MPALKEKRISVYVLSDACSTDGIKGISQAITQAPDEALSPSLRANVKFNSTALYIYTSGTTGNNTHRCSRLSDNTRFTLNTNKPNGTLKKHFLILLALLYILYRQMTKERKVKLVAINQ